MPACLLPREVAGLLEYAGGTEQRGPQLCRADARPPDQCPVRLRKKGLTLRRARAENVNEDVTFSKVDLCGRGYEHASKSFYFQFVPIVSAERRRGVGLSGLEVLLEVTGGVA